MPQAHRNEAPRRSPKTELARLVREASRYSDRGLVVALVSADDKQAFIGTAIRSLIEQSSAPDLIVLCVEEA